MQLRMQEMENKSPMKNRCFYIAFGLLVFLHLGKAGLFIAAGQPPLQGDAKHYWSVATRMAEGDWLAATVKPETIRTPGYPMVLVIFQLLFGRYALVAATVFQQVVVFVTAFITAWMCYQATGSKLGGLTGLTLSLFCISQNSVATYLLSDPLFGLLVTASVAALIAWVNRPTFLRAAIVGIMLGAATLVKPIAQLAWIPVAIVMVLNLYGPGVFRRSLGHVLCLVVAMLVLLMPCYARNYYCFGQVFLTKTAGITIWQSLFGGKINDPLDPPVPFADTPRTVAVLKQLEGVDLRDHWAVLPRLEQLNYSRMEANDLMQGVCVDAIKAHPWKYLASRAHRFAWFWITPNGTFRPNTHLFRLFTLKADGSSDSQSQRLGSYYNQFFWFSDAYFRQGCLNWLWHPNPWSYLLVALFIPVGLIAMARKPGQRVHAIAFAMLLLYFSVLTVVGARPEYRYRMILEPIIIASVVPVVMDLIRMIHRIHKQRKETSSCNRG